MSQSNGFVSFDLLFAALPVILMLAHMLTVAEMASETGESILQSKETPGKLATIADYIVKRGAVERSSQGTGFLGTASYRPNVIDEAELGRIDKKLIMEWMELDSLEISWEKGEGNCIYRLVLLEGEVKKLYVCGE
ncbi:hypothetical protein GF412_00190 [Candidatus Micrarchaeota archaeon]|nr:hypothetical protein [Candidatus Micrarchaeota archaeon]MBD3417394.1 hypothetical protein [Candidatus Micrarchaeota archaeon]